MAGIIPDSRAGRTEERNLSGLNPFLGHPLMKQGFLSSTKRSVTLKGLVGFRTGDFQWVRSLSFSL